MTFETTTDHEVWEIRSDKSTRRCRDNLGEDVAADMVRRFNADEVENSRAEMSRHNRAFVVVEGASTRKAILPDRSPTTSNPSATDT